MPALSLTVRDIHRILENSRTYEAFARNGPVLARVPAFDKRENQIRRRARSRSRSRSRNRYSRLRGGGSCDSLNISHSRAPKRRCHGCGEVQCRCDGDFRSPQRPSSAGSRQSNSSYRPKSAQIIGARPAQRPQSAQTRPHSAKASLPPRPSSAHARPSSAHVRRSHSHSTDDRKNVDYSGLSNMVRNMNIQPTRRWRSKSPSRHTVDKTKPERNVKERAFEDVVIDTKALRKSRASSYSKFRYPEQYHSSPINRHLLIEEQVPACLRKFPRYINQPRRHGCGYTPQGGKAVSFVASHSIHSRNIPPRMSAEKKQPSRQASREFLASSREMLHDQYANVIGPDSARDDTDDDAQRNDTYSYVYSGPSDVTVDVHRDFDDGAHDANGRDDVQSIQSYNSADFEDSDDDVTRPTSTINNHRTNTQSASNTSKSSRTKTQSQGHTVQQLNDSVEEEIVEEVVNSDDSPAGGNDFLPRSKSDEDFEALMNNITSGGGGGGGGGRVAGAVDVRSPERLQSPTFGFSDDDDVTNILDRPISPVSSEDDDSIPEDIQRD